MLSPERTLLGDGRCGTEGISKQRRDVHGHRIGGTFVPFFSRRRFLQVAPSVAAIGGWRLPGAHAQGVAKAPENFRTMGAPVVQCPTASSVTVVWGVNDTSTGWVEYGETEALGQIAMADGEGLHPLDAVVHKITLPSLRPATRYYYRTVSVPIAFLGAYDIRRGRPFESPIHQFVTADDGAGNRVRFSVINDTHENPETLKTVFTRLASEPGDLTFWNGDMFNDIATEKQMAEQLLYPANMAYAARTPVYFARGNHDVRGAEARALGRFVAAPNGSYYYSFRQGPVAFIVLDTGEDKDDTHPVYAGLGTFDAYRTRQAGWLADELRKEHVRSAPFRVVVAHIPLYSTRPTQAHGGADARAKWHDHLVKGRVDVLITGHTHRYAYMEPDATRPFGQITGGGPQPAAATIISGEATAQDLRIVMRTLDGVSVGEYAYTRRT